MQLKNKTEVACLYQDGNSKELKSEILLTKRPIHQKKKLVKLIKIEYEIMLKSPQYRKKADVSL